MMSKGKPAMKQVIILVVLASTIGTANIININSLQSVSQIQAKSNNDDAQIVINNNEFKNAFKTFANSRFTSNDEVTLTPNLPSQVGYVSFNDKIDMRFNFSLVGQVYLGKKDGADGVSFILHPNDKDYPGGNGSQIGIGGISNAVAFKLDTFFNSDTDPDEFKNEAFGAFVSTNSDGLVDSLTNAQKISEPD